MSWRGTSLLPRPPVIILNSSPVIHLTVALGGLDALPALYGQVLVPEPVLRELEAGAQLDDNARRLRTVSGVEVYALANGVSPLLAGELDLGEAAVIQLALDLPGATVVLDDLKARRVARRSSIPMTGSLGVLLHVDIKRSARRSRWPCAVEQRDTGWSEASVEAPGNLGDPHPAATRQAAARSGALAGARCCARRPCSRPRHCDPAEDRPSRAVRAERAKAPGRSGVDRIAAPRAPVPSNCYSGTPSWNRQYVIV